MRNKLASFGVDPYDLSIISQSDCPSHKNGTEGVNINIDPETFSSHNIGQAVRKTGSAIGETFLLICVRVVTILLSGLTAAKHDTGLLF